MLRYRQLLNIKQVSENYITHLERRIEAVEEKIKRMDEIIEAMLL